MPIGQAIKHDRMLLGAIDSFLKEFVHVRPFLFTRYEEALTTMAERWLADGGENQLSALDDQWLYAHWARSPHGKTGQAALADFYRWALRAGLVETNPLEQRGRIRRDTI